MSLSNTKAIQRREDAQHRLRVKGAALDVREIPSFGFGHRSIMWWATQGLIAIESTVFAIAVGAYFYLRSHANRWPPTELPPDLLWGTLNTLLMLLSFLPAYFTKQAAETLALPKVRVWITLSTVASLVILAVRALEFST
jgi:cytochrome c oxidase subunit III